MIRVLLTSCDSVSGKEVILLDSETLHHLRKVIRAEIGERVDVLTGEGRVFRGNLISLDERKAVVSVFEEKVLTRRPPRLILAVSLLSSSRFDEVLDKVAEFGVDKLVPMICDRTIVQLKKGEVKDRWLRRLSQVCRSVGTPFLPEVEPVMGFEDVLARFAPEVARIFIPCLGSNSRHLLKELLEFQELRESGTSILILIGPEGDFSVREVELAQKAGAVPVTLGPLVLRVETATGVCAGMVHMVRSMDL